MATGLPTATITEIETAPGVWTAITTSVVGDSIDISVGKDSPGGDLQPGVLELDLDNSDGTWTPDNPLSTAYSYFKEGTRIRVRVTKGSTVPKFVGRIVTIEPDYPDVPTQSITHVTAVDAIGDLARMDCPPALLGVIQALFTAAAETAPIQSFWYWPLTGGYRLTDAVTGAESMTFFQPSAGGEVSWEADSSFPLGGDACLSMTAGVGLQVGLRTHVAGLLNDHRIGGAFHLQTGAAGVVFSATDMKTTAALVTGVVVWWDGAGTVSVRQYTAGTPTTLVSIAVAPGWHTISVYFGSTAEEITVDGVDTATGILVAPPTVITVGGSIDMSVRDLYLTSSTALDSYLVDTGASLTTITSNVATALRLTDLGAAIAWSSSVSGVRATAVPTEGRKGIDVLSDLANSQSGHAYVAYSTSDPQVITLVANKDARPTSVALTVDAENDLDGGPTLDRNVYGKVGTATGKNAALSVLVVDDDLAAAFSAGSAEKQSALALANDLAASASDLISQSRDSKLRLSEVSIDLATAQADLYAAWFATTIGERIRVSGLPSTYFGVTYLDGYLLGYKEQPGITGYRVLLKLLPADAPPQAKYNDTTYGRFAWGDGKATVTSGTAVGGTGNGTLVITTPSGPCLTTSAGAYPLQLDWNGECVTITSAPASGSSPQTVTTTARGQNGTVARAHSAGEPVEIWRAARFAL